MFDIVSLQADADNNVVSIGWIYTNNGGSRTGSVNLPGAVGPVPASTVSKSDLITYVKVILPEGTEELLDAQIVKDLAAAALDVHNVTVPA